MLMPMLLLKVDQVDDFLREVEEFGGDPDFEEWVDPVNAFDPAPDSAAPVPARESTGGHPCWDA